MNTKVKLLALFVAAVVCMGSCQARPEPEVVQEPEEEETEIDEPIEEVVVVETPTPTPLVVETPEPTEPPEPPRDWTVEAEHLAKTVYGEALNCSKTERAAVMWCILNRVDSEIAYFPDDIVGVVTQYQQFHGYSPKHPVEADLFELALDVIDRWEREKDGEENVGRVLPSEWLYFHGDLVKHNYFHKEYLGKEVWDWGLPSPYED